MSTIEIRLKPNREIVLPEWVLKKFKIKVIDELQLSEEVNGEMTLGRSYYVNGRERDESWPENVLAGYDEAKFEDESYEARVAQRRREGTRFSFYDPNGDAPYYPWNYDLSIGGEL